MAEIQDLVTEAYRLGLEQGAKDDYVKVEEASGCSCGCGAPSEIYCYDLPEG